MTNRATAGALAVLIAVAGCRSARVETAEAPLPAAGAPTDPEVVPAGTRLEVELNQRLGTDATRVDDAFTATLEQPVVSAGGVTMIPRGAVLHGRVTGLKHSDSVGDPAVIRLNFEQISFSGRTYPLSAAILRTEVAADNQVDLKDVAQKAAIGAAAGAVLGAVLGGSSERAVSGAILGAGVGTLVSLGTGDVEAALPAGTDMLVQTTQSIRLR